MYYFLGQNYEINKSNQSLITHHIYEDAKSHWLSFTAAQLKTSHPHHKMEPGLARK